MSGIRQLVFGMVTSLLFAGISSSALAEIVVTDITGREIRLDKPATRIILGEGRFMLSLSIVSPNPADIVVGMLDEFENYDPSGYEIFKQAFPQVEDIARYGTANQESVSAEKIISLKPEVAFFGLRGHGPNITHKELVNQLEAAGIQVVFIDFTIDLLKNTPKSIEIIGKIIGQDKKAADFSKFYQRNLERVSDKVKDIAWDQRPRTFIEVHAGKFDCCVSMANGMLGPLVEFSGGRNVSKETTPAVVGRHTFEYLIEQNPDILIATASSAIPKDGKISKTLFLGSGIKASSSQEGLKFLSLRPGFEVLKAVQSNNMFGIFHNFYNSAWNIYAVLAFAKWQHPDLFTDLDPDAVMEDMQKKFLPFEISGTYGVGLN